MAGSIFPGLDKLSGGEKQHWINRNLDLILLLHENLGFQETRKALNMKSETLEKALVKAERHHRPVVTRADRAMNKAMIVESKVYNLEAEVSRQGVDLSDHTARDQQLREYLAQFFELQSRANGMMAELVKSVSNFTYHLDSPNKRKVGLTRLSNQGRLSLFSGQGRGLPRPGIKESPKHRRCHYLKRRRPGV